MLNVDPNVWSISVNPHRFCQFLQLVSSSSIVWLVHDYGNAIWRPNCVPIHPAAPSLGDVLIEEMLLGILTTGDPTFDPAF